VEATTSPIPNRLIITRIPTRTGAGPSVVTSPTAIASLYTHLLALPEPSVGVCPTYVRTEWILNFSQGTHTPLLKARILQGGCTLVILSTTTKHVRVPDPALWKMLTAVGVTKDAHTGGGLTPANLQSAYSLPSMTRGKGQTVAIVDAFDDPQAEHDLAVYRATFHLPACTTRNGCFRKVNEWGGTGRPRTDSGWSGEIALDLDMVSAVCPLCHILLVEASSASLLDLGKGVDTAVKLGATVVSNSYGVTEDATARRYAVHYDHPGVVITASSGDGGYGVQVPASYGSVTAVGGTTLSVAHNARGWQETAWYGSGSGCSKDVSKPIWQNDQGCQRRSVVDVSAVGDPSTGVAVYSTYGDATGWLMLGGTSASSPIIAGVYALAGNARETTGERLYTHYRDFNDIVSGSNGECVPAYLCNAGKGYDGPTGLGTPKGIGAF